MLLVVALLLVIQIIARELAPRGDKNHTSRRLVERHASCAPRTAVVLLPNATDPHRRPCCCRRRRRQITIIFGMLLLPRSSAAGGARGPRPDPLLLPREHTTAVVVLLSHVG